MYRVADGFEPTLDLAPEARVEQQVFGRVTADREFREHHDVGAEPSPGIDRLFDDPACVALDVTDEEIDLR